MAPKHGEAISVQPLCHQYCMPSSCLMGAFPNLALSLPAQLLSNPLLVLILVPDFVDLFFLWIRKVLLYCISWCAVYPSIGFLVISMCMYNLLNYISVSLMLGTVSFILCKYKMTNLQNWLVSTYLPKPLLLYNCHNSHWPDHLWLHFEHAND